MFLTIAPGYFRHLADVLSDGRPTALLQIVGVYTVSATFFAPSKDSMRAEPVSPHPFAPASAAEQALPGGEGEGASGAAMGAEREPSLTPTHSLSALLSSAEASQPFLSAPLPLQQQQVLAEPGPPRPATPHAREALELKHVKMHLVVVENLFCADTDLEAKFDLKGNLRNRLVAAPKPGEVLLDQNLRDFTGGLPVPLTRPAKETLILALESDTRFLEEQGVVDYSLLVGFPRALTGGAETDDAEATSGEALYAGLRVGIIDYLQLYTVKKMIESNVKRAGMIAGQLEPTVIDPAGYRARMLKAMDRYFCAVPDAPSELDEKHTAGAEHLQQH